MIGADSLDDGVTHGFRDRLVANFVVSERQSDPEHHPRCATFAVDQGVTSQDWHVKRQTVWHGSLAFVCVNYVD